MNIAIGKSLAICFVAGITTGVFGLLAAPIEHYLDIDLGAEHVISWFMACLITVYTTEIASLHRRIEKLENDNTKRLMGMK